jgi:hypothetical protein
MTIFNTRNARRNISKTSRNDNNQESFDTDTAASGHLPLARTIWSQTIRKGDIVVDATCGNGHDSLSLSQLAMDKEHGRLICIDIQDIAINATKDKLSREIVDYSSISDRIFYYCQSHATFPEILLHNSVAVINYNLGYLPRGERDMSYEVGKGAITQASSTVESLINALSLIRVQGVITVTSYRGHPGGMDEYLAVRNFCEKLDSKIWRVYSHEPLNRPISPVLLSIMKSKVKSTR